MTVATSKKTRQGLKLYKTVIVMGRHLSCNEQENPTGIETCAGGIAEKSRRFRCNEQENPTGIETFRARHTSSTPDHVATSKKTRQGLKHKVPGSIEEWQAQLQRARKPDRD